MSATTITSADGTELSARCSGEGSPLVLVHGANGDLDTFAPVEGVLAERHAVWVYSRRGRGGSGDGPDYAFDREVEDVLAVVDAAGAGAHLVGHSGGALYSLFAAARATSLRSLVLYEPPLDADRFDPSVIERAEAALDAGNPDGALESFFPAAGIVDGEAQTLRSLDTVWERLRRGAERLPREARAIDVVPDRLRSFEPPDVPTLYLYGEETAASIYVSPSEIAERFPKFQLQGFPGQRHLAFAFDPAAFARAVLTFTTTHDN